MTDIVQRLRDPRSRWVSLSEPDPLRLEAADEIERLRERVASLQATSGYEAAIAQAEIERLRDHMRALADTSVHRDAAGIFKGLWQGSEKECDELRAEIERLKRKKGPPAGEG